MGIFILSSRLHRWRSGIKCMGPSVQCRAHWLVYLVMSAAKHVNIVLTHQTFKKFLQKENITCGIFLLCFTRLFWPRKAAWTQQEIPLNVEIALQGNFTTVPFHQVGSKAQFFLFFFLQASLERRRKKHILTHPNWFPLQNACDCKPLITCGVPASQNILFPGFYWLLSETGPGLWCLPVGQTLSALLDPGPLLVWATIRLSCAPVTFSTPRLRFLFPGVNPWRLELWSLQKWKSPELWWDEGVDRSLMEHSGGGEGEVCVNTAGRE